MISVVKDLQRGSTVISECLWRWSAGRCGWRRENWTERRRDVAWRELTTLRRGRKRVPWGTVFPNCNHCLSPPRFLWNSPHHLHNYVLNFFSLNQFTFWTKKHVYKTGNISFENGDLHNSEYIGGLVLKVKSFHKELEMITFWLGTVACPWLWTWNMLTVSKELW